MDYNNFYDLDEILKYFGYKKKEENKDKDECNESFEKEEIKIDKSGGASTNECKNLNLDMPFGFQDLDPMLMLVIGELIANSISSKIPSSVLNAYGNWLQMIGQVIETFNAQQQYHEGGPGRYYNAEYKNIDNPFCSSEKEQCYNCKNNRKSSKKDDSDKIKKLTLRIDNLESEIKELKKIMKEYL